MQHSSYVSRGGQWNDMKNQANIHRVQDYLKSWRNNKIAKLLFPSISKKIVMIEFMEHNTCQVKTVWSCCQQGQHQPNYCMTHFCPKMQKVNVRKILTSKKMLEKYKILCILPILRLWNYKILRLKQFIREDTSPVILLFSSFLQE